MFKQILIFFWTHLTVFLLNISQKKKKKFISNKKKNQKLQLYMQKHKSEPRGVANHQQQQFCIEILDNLFHRISIKKCTLNRLSITKIVWIHNDYSIQWLLNSHQISYKIYLSITGKLFVQYNLLSITANFV